jgi:hypothetical protein
MTENEISAIILDVEIVFIENWAGRGCLSPCTKKRWHMN